MTTTNQTEATESQWTGVFLLRRIYTSWARPKRRRGKPIYRSKIYRPKNPPPAPTSVNTADYRQRQRNRAKRR